MTEKYKTGDVVQLKSGGPKMTVAYTATNPINQRVQVWCDWFAGSKHEHAGFPEDAIEPAQPAKKP